MDKRLESLLTLTLAISALGVSGTYVYRTMYPPQRQAEVNAAAIDKQLWNRALASGHQIAGDSASPATMVVFTDFECPACRGFHSTRLGGLLAKYPRDLRVVYVHFPLPYHAQAAPAARATECVAGVGDLQRWVDLLYAKQDSLGKKSYAAFAHDIGIADTARITTCSQATDPVERIDAGLALGKLIKISGTPGVVLNGRLYPNPPSEATIDSVVRSARSGRNSRE